MQTENKYNLRIIEQELINLIKQTNDARLNSYITKGIEIFAKNEEEARQKATKNHDIMRALDIQRGTHSNADEVTLKINSDYFKSWEDSKLTSCEKI